jgi:alpha-galactosidase
LFDVRDENLDYDLLRRLTGQWRQISDCYLGDYYPLTHYNTGPDVWMAWQFNLPEAGKGFVQAFRRDKCIFEVGRLKLRGLEPDAQYRVTDLDAGKAQQVGGRELMETGLRVSITDQPGAAAIIYERAE